MLAGRPPVWRQDDSLLAAAHARYLAERVGPSGYPLRLAADVGKRFGWDVDASTVDYAQTVLDGWARDRSEKDVDAVVPKVTYQEIKRPNRPGRLHGKTGS
nr:MAG TPA: hypothetical protein [Caudoviricetes sp.]